MGDITAIISLIETLYGKNVPFQVLGNAMHQALRPFTDTPGVMAKQEEKAKKVIGGAAKNGVTKEKLYATLKEEFKEGISIAEREQKGKELDTFEQEVEKSLKDYGMSDEEAKYMNRIVCLLATKAHQQVMDEPDEERRRELAKKLVGELISQERNTYAACRATVNGGVEGLQGLFAGRPEELDGFLVRTGQTVSYYEILSLRQAGDTVKAAQQEEAFKEKCRVILGDKGEKKAKAEDMKRTFHRGFGR